MAGIVRHLKTNVRFEIIKEEKNYYVVIKHDEPEIKLRLEKFAVDGKMFKVESQKKAGKSRSRGKQQARA